MERISDIIKGKSSGMTFLSEYCEKHTYRKMGQEYTKPVQMMEINGKKVCPRCQVENEDEKLRSDYQYRYERQEKMKKYNTLKNKSLLEDETLIEANLSSYKPEGEEDKKNFRKMLSVVDRFKNGEKFNVFLQGSAGVGKSYLSYAALKELNRHPDLNDPEDKGVSCLFINMESMFHKIKATFDMAENNPNKKYTEDYFRDLISEVDFLCIDDLGAESGSEHVKKSASDFIIRILYAITNKRQGKATIFTTNLNSESLYNLYDTKVIDRILRQPEYLIYKDTKTKRAKLPF